MLSIIIVNFRSSRLVADCIRSALEFNSMEAEWIVVDNDSQDESRSLILGAFPHVHWTQMDYNAGFARANNEGIRTAKGDVVLLLNPDTVSVDDSISRCYHQLKQSSYIAAGVQLFDRKMEPQIPGSFFMKGGINHILPIPYWGDLLKWLGRKTATKVPHVKKAGALQEVDWISGAFLMVKQDAIANAGLMDEDFFLYAEEVEWCSRLKKQGSLCIFGDLSIIHLEGGSIDASQQVKEKGYYNLYDRKGLQLMVSNHLRVRKQYGVAWFLFLLLNYTWGVAFYFTLSFIHRLVTLRNPVAEWGRAVRFLKNVMHLWWLSPRIISGKPYFYKMF